MATDKKDYEDTIKAMIDHSTLTALINKLNKIFVGTEDAVLRNHLGPIIGNFKQAALNQTKQTVQTLRLDDPRFQPVAAYCKKCIESTKPQWQIIAEKHGWGPLPK
jgi:hypothetical protein